MAMSGAILVLNAGSSSLKFYPVCQQRRQSAAAAARPDRGADHCAGIRRARRAGPGRGSGATGPIATRSATPVRLRTCSTLSSKSGASARSPPSATASCTAARSSRAGADRCRCLARLETTRAARAVAPAAQSRADASRCRARSRRCRKSPASTPRFTAHRAGRRAGSDCAARVITERGVRRYGFHGLSYEYIAVSAAAIRSCGARGPGRRARISATAPACARCKAGRSIATTMGFTAARRADDGHARRFASIPASLLYLAGRAQDGRARDRAARSTTQSGLLGVSGVSSDMRTLLVERRPAVGVRDRRCSLPHQAASWVRCAAALGGIDAIVFTGGNRRARGSSVRERVC